MSSSFSENVYTHIFTPKEYQVELLESAKKGNTVMCSSTSTSKAFVVVKLLQECSWLMRKATGQKGLLILDMQNVPIMTSHVKYLTDLNVVSISEIIQDKADAEKTIKNYQVIVTTAEIFVEILNLNVLHDLTGFSLLVIEGCLHGRQVKFAKFIMNIYKKMSEEHRPRILGLTTGLLHTDMQPHRLEAELRRLEKLLHSAVDTSSEVVTLIRLSYHPHETVIECSKMKPMTLDEEIRMVVENIRTFFLDHRYDPSEIYDGELLEEMKEVPDPTKIPLELLDEILAILDDLGPWGADKAALNILSKIEKLKIKTPYERHYLLLCALSTTFVNIRAICDYEFDKLEDIERLQTYSSPKALQFLEVLKQFKPSKERPVVEEKPKQEEPEVTNVKVRFKGKGPRRTFIPRPNMDDVLCAVIFVHSRYKAKALFALLCVSITIFLST